VKGLARTADGVSIAYESRGTGAPALVFVHGWSCDSSYWGGQLDYFGARQQVVSVDLAGHGESGTDRHAWTMPAFGSDVAAVVDGLELERLVLIGHSMGGDVITEAAAQLSDRVVGVVWVDTWRTLGELATPEELEAFVRPLREDFISATRDLVRAMFLPSSDPVLVERVALDMSAAPPEIALPALEHAVANDGPILATLSRVRAPVVALNPDYRQTDVEALRRYGVETEVVPGVGHFLMLEDPDAFNRALSEVVERFTE
jgi:pimeloyl-ACP methyl ester carboxylesterase